MHKSLSLTTRAAHTRLPSLFHPLQERRASSSSSSYAKINSKLSSTRKTSSKEKRAKQLDMPRTEKNKHRQVKPVQKVRAMEEGKVKVLEGRFVSSFDRQHPFFTPHMVHIGKVSDRPVTIPDGVMKPPYHRTGENTYHELLDFKTHDQIESMRASCRLARKTLDFALAQVAEGVTTEEIDRRVTDYILSHGAYPSPLNYGHFPKSICTSVNEVMVHGIPDDRALKLGDMINIDITVYLNGYHGDCSATTIVGMEDDARSSEVNPLHVHIMETTQRALRAAIDICGPDVPFTRIGDTIEATIEKSCQELQSAHAEKLGGRKIKYAISKDFCGHGIGQFFHGFPQIIHHRNNYRNDIVGAKCMKPGMTFTIEPILCGQSSKSVLMPDKWTAISVDRCINSQFEHTILITRDGVEVLTVDETDKIHP